MDLLNMLSSISKGVAYPAMNGKNLLSDNYRCSSSRRTKSYMQKGKTLMELCDQLEQEIDTSQQQIEDLMQSVLKEVYV